jgi:hypothetical protein
MRCENCGNNYDKAFQVTMMGKQHTFDSFECAINVLAPRCAHCDTRIIGHGVQNDETMYCCVHCAEAEGVKDLKDHA